MKNNKKKTISEAAAEAMGLGGAGGGDYDTSGRGSFDMSQKGPMTPSPVITGAPAITSPVPGAQALGAAVPASTDEESEEHENSETTEEEMQEQAREQFRTALYQILGEDVASEDLVVKLEAIFEAAVTERVENTVAAIVEGVDQNVKTYLDNVTEALVEKVDDYLDYVVEEWLTENTVSVEQGIKTQIAENFISGLKNLFENHYIDVPNEKYNVLDELYAQNRELQGKLNEAVNKAIELNKEVSLTECAGIFVAETRDLADTQVAKLQNLMENISFGSPEEYREKLVTIRENYVNGSKVKAPTKFAEPEQTFSAVKSAPTTLVENYVGALGRLHKKL
jgi:hypothetical protein